MMILWTTKTLKQKLYHRVAKNLTTIEEEELIKHINMLTDHGLPPTSAMVQNIAEEMIG